MSIHYKSQKVYRNRKSVSVLACLTVFLLSCSGETKSVRDIIDSNDETMLQKKKNELVAQQQDIVAQIRQIDERLKTLIPERNISLVTIFTTQSEVFNHYLELQGSVQTKQNLVITPEMGGVLKQVYVKEGQRVRQGQLLASIDDGGLKQQKAQLQVQADLAKTTYERQKRLWEQKVGSEMQFLQAKSQYEALKASVNQVHEQLEKTNVVAPFSGIIDDVITEQGSVVSPGQTSLIRLVNLDDMYIEAAIPEKYISHIAKGKEAKVTFPIFGTTVHTKVRQTGNFINPANRTFKIEIGINNKDQNIKPNLTAQIQINDYTNPKAILIPQSIISENSNGDQYIYAVENKKANTATVKQVIIETGRTQEDFIEVLSGLDSGMEVIKAGARSVKDGQVVKIVEGL